MCGGFWGLCQATIFASIFTIPAQVLNHSSTLLWDDSTPPWLHPPTEAPPVHPTLSISSLFLWPWGGRGAKTEEQWKVHSSGRENGCFGVLVTDDTDFFTCDLWSTQLYIPPPCNFKTAWNETILLKSLIKCVLSALCACFSFFYFLILTTHKALDTLVKTFCYLISLFDFLFFSFS